MSTNLEIGKDITGTPCDTIGISKDNYSATLAAGVENSITVPQNVDRVYFAFGNGGDVWVAINQTASIPGSTFTNNTFQLNPVSRFVYPGQTISVICATSNSIQIAFYNKDVRGT